MFGRHVGKMKTFKLLTVFRGVYCAAVAITLLNLPLELPRESFIWEREGDMLLTNVPEWLARCKRSSTFI